MSGLREAFNEIVTDVPVYGDLDRAIERADRERLRRHGTVGALVAAAAVVAVIVGVFAVTRDGNDSLQPIGPPTPTEKIAPTPAPADAMVNGRIQGIEAYLARVRPACGDCYMQGFSFNQDTGTLLVTTRRGGDGPVSVSVIGAGGLLAELSCSADFTCPDDQTGTQTLGPGADELTVLSSPQQVQVIGYDGTVRRTIDLSAVLDDPFGAVELVWSPDGTRLAVKTRGYSSGLISHVWLVNSDGGDPQRVHTASYTGPLDGKRPLGYIWSLAWSPDGRRLGFIEEHARIGRFEESLLVRAVSLLLPDPGEEGPGTATTLYDYRKKPFDSAAFVWSPDGTRAAVRVPDQVLELSAEDGSILARQPFRCSSPNGSCLALIWPQKDR